MRQTIFLDFDGVVHALAGPAHAMRQFVWMPILLELLSEHHDVGIVVHASARQHSPADFIRSRAGIPKHRFVDVTDPKLGRWASIQKWVGKNPSEYCILDDQPSEFQNPLPSQLIVCDSAKGISDLHVQHQIRAWLNRE